MSVVVENITKHFAGKGSPPAVKEASFEAKPAEITALLGPSGSGKSTLLRIIAGLESSDSGRIVIGGKDATGVSARFRNVGFVFQNYALFRHLTVFENIAFGLRVRKTPREQIHARVAELMDLIHLKGYEARFPSQLSGGQRQRVALARALATKPDVLLLDEPFGALDARVRVELRRSLAELQQQTHTTTVLVTHDQEEAFELAQHVVLLSDGSVVQAGAPQEIYDRPATPFVATFVGASNELSGTIQAGGAQLGAFRLSAPTGSPDGARVRAFVRPTDVRLEKDAPPSSPSVASARVEGLARLGAHARLSLALPGGGSVLAQIPTPELELLDIERGDSVMVDLARAKVFVA